MNERLRTLRAKMQGANIQGMIISNPINIKYFTGIDAEGVFLITRKENVYITDGRYIEYVSNTLTPFDEIVVNDIKDVSLEDYENFFLFCESVGFEEKYVTYHDYKEYMHRYKINSLVEAEELIEDLRLVKDDEEIRSIKEACEITDKCFEMLKEYIKPGMTEKQIARRIDNFYYAHAEGSSFDTIVASGENSSMPHAVPGNRKIQEQDIILIDMGCKVNGYCSDMTRIIFVGEPTDEQKRIYEIVLKEQQRVLNELRDGANIKTINKVLLANFESNGYELIHALGHGVGLEIHEKPNVSIKNDTNLKENMVITDEPGIYIPGYFGVRIEDTVLITKQGCIELTKTSKEITKIY